MKKLLMGTAFLTVIGVAITASQFSCTKGSAQASTTGLTQLNKIIYSRKEGVTRGIWTANYDGTNQTKINIVLPNGIAFADKSVCSLSPDGKKVFFLAGPPEIVGGSTTNSTLRPQIYSCNIDGSNVTKIVDATYTDFNDNLGGAY